MKHITYRRPDESESVGILRLDTGAPVDLIRALRCFGISGLSVPVRLDETKIPKHRCAARDEGVPIITDMLDLLDAGFVDVEALGEITSFLNDHSLIDDLTEHEFKTLAPIARPRAIYALGRNYPAHARETGAEVPTEPIVFTKAPTAVIGPDDDVIYKSWLTRVDPEAELAVVIGRCGKDISEADAPAYIAGYTILNDVTARDIQKVDLAAGHPWLRSKGIDTFCPMGPNITLPDEIGQPTFDGAQVELEVEMRVNGELRQKDNTRSMTFSVPYLIGWISRYHTLYPGDVITTGTPEGIAPVKPGDVMEATVEKIGTLRNKIVSE